jgi:hypothetical protein
MSTGANALSIVTLVFPDPRVFSAGGTPFTELNEYVSFRYDAPGPVVTLSSTDANPKSDISGLLYLPQLDPGSSCEPILGNYVPQNATSQVHLPVGTQHGFLAIAPWISTVCTKDFLWAARDDPLRAFVFFLPNQDTTVPLSNDAAWDLGDGGKWKKNAKFPVYVISGASGNLILNEMALYSGNLTTVPFGQMLADEFPPNAYVRLAGTISLGKRKVWSPLLQKVRKLIENQIPNRCFLVSGSFFWSFWAFSCSLLLQPHVPCTAYSGAGENACDKESWMAR